LLSSYALLSIALFSGLHAAVCRRLLRGHAVAPAEALR
jgi:hypothetical protein